MPALLVARTKNATTCSGSAKDGASAYRRSKASLAGLNLHAYLESRKAELESALRGVKKMLRLLPEDSDIRAALFR